MTTVEISNHRHSEYLPNVMTCDVTVRYDGKIYQEEADVALVMGQWVVRGDPDGYSPEFWLTGTESFFAHQIKSIRSAVEDYFNKLQKEKGAL